MQFLKLSLFRLEGGSAVTEFVMVVVPVTLIMMTFLSFFGAAFSSLIIKQRLYEVVRFAALADVSAAEAQDYLDAQLPGSQVAKVKSLTGCVVVGQKNTQFGFATFLPPLELTLRAVATCENP